MLLAIDIGNTQSVYGLWTGSEWAAIWRRSTRQDETEDEIAAWLKLLFQMGGFEFVVDQVVVASVVPPLDSAISYLSEKWLGCKAGFLRTGEQVGLQVDYEPKNAVGADRLANCIAALARFETPIIVVDFGTATTFDIVNRDRVYVGGAIMTGVQVSTEALAGRTAKLPKIDLVAPKTAIGKNTVHALQSGIMIGYAGAVDALVKRIDGELGGGATVLSTGGLGGTFMGLCETIRQYEPSLTLDGLVLAAPMLS